MWPVHYAPLCQAQLYKGIVTPSRKTNVSDRESVAVTCTNIASVCRSLNAQHRRLHHPLSFAISLEQRIAGSSAPYKSAKNKGKYKAAHEKDTRLRYKTGTRQGGRKRRLMCKGNMKQVSRTPVKQRTKRKLKQQALQSTKSLRLTSCNVAGKPLQQADKPRHARGGASARKQRQIKSGRTSIPATGVKVIGQVATAVHNSTIESVTPLSQAASMAHALSETKGQRKKSLTKTQI